MHILSLGWENKVRSQSYWQAHVMWSRGDDARVSVAPYYQESQNQCFIINLRACLCWNSHLHSAVFWAWVSPFGFKLQQYHLLVVVFWLNI